jgi:V-type H+-transporting ATPase proteolipid subunit
MAGIIAVYGLVISVLIIGNSESPYQAFWAAYEPSDALLPTVSPDQDYSLYAGFIHLAAGLACGMCGLAAGHAIGLIGDACARAYMQQSR